MKTRSRCIMPAMAAFLTLMLLSHAQGATLILPASLDGSITHSFGGSPQRVYDFLGVTNSSFTTDLGTLSSMTAELSVGTGNIINVDLPTGKTGTFNVYLNYLGTGSFGATDTWTNTVQFLGLTGTAPTLDSLQTTGRVQGNQVSIQASYSFTEAFSFQGWKTDINGPFASGGSMTFDPNTSNFYFNYQDTADGGQFVTISAVPEPSRAVLGALGLGALLMGTRRRTRAVRG